MINRRQFLANILKLSATLPALVKLPFVGETTDPAISAFVEKLETIMFNTLKSLSDPKNPLRQVGVSFSDEQEAQIEEMVEADKKVEAQRLILDRLDEELGE